MCVRHRRGIVLGTAFAAGVVTVLNDETAVNWIE
jgi:hypothetical protein